MENVDDRIQRSLGLLPVAVLVMACSGGPSSFVGGHGGGAGGAGGVGGNGPGGGGGSACTPGASEPCYGGPPGTANLGICTPGMRTCNDDGTAFGPCTGEVTPLPETCKTPQDDDCDGKVNEEGEGCVCTPSATYPCYSGPPGTLGTGACQGGMAECDAQGLGLGPCVGEVVPAPETCETPLDEDCDGLANEEGSACTCIPGMAIDCYTGAPGTQGIGACHAGTSACAPTGTTYEACIGEVVPSVEACGNGVDEDCDGLADEGCGPVCAAQASGPGASFGNAVAVSPDGGFYAVGYFSKSLVFGHGEAAETTLASAGQFDIFVARYNPDCTLAWTRRAGGTAADVASDIAVLSDGSVVVTGSIAGPATFGAGEPGETTLTVAAVSAFVARYGANGALVWAHAAEGSGVAAGADVAARVDDGFFVLGTFSGTATWGQGEPGEMTRTSAGGNDAFLARYAPDGALVWVEQAGGAGQDCTDPQSRMCTVSAAADGGALIGGSFIGSAVFGQGQPGMTTLVSDWGLDQTGQWAPGADAFVARYAQDGSLAWAKRAGGPAYREGTNTLVATEDGGAVVAGICGWNLSGQPNEMTFGPGEPAPKSISCASTGEIFVARYQSNGSPAWVERIASGNSGDSATRILLDPNGTTLLVGTYFDTMTFGPGEPQETTLTNGGGFLARHGPLGALEDAQRISSGAAPLGSDLGANGVVAMIGRFCGNVTFRPDAPEGGLVLSASDGPCGAFFLRYAP